jgi:two-component system sensor histidine kinase YesM
MCFGDIWDSLGGRLRICGVAAIAGIAAATLFSFVSAWRSAYDTVNDYFRKTETEMALRLKNSIDDIQSAVRNAGYSIAIQRVLLSSTPETAVKNFNTAVDHITGILNASQSCRNIYIQNSEGRHLWANRYRLAEMRESIAANIPGGVLNRPLFETRRNEEGWDELYFYSPVYNILWSERSSRIICAAACDMSGITAASSVMESGFEGTVLLLYKNRIVSSSREISPEEREVLPQTVSGRGRMAIGGENCLTIKVSLPGTPGRGTEELSEQLWDCIYFISEKAVISRILSQMNKGLPLLSAVMLLIIFIMALLIHSVNTGVSRLVEDLNVLEYRQKHSLSRPRLRELALISHSVGLMLDRINGAALREREIGEKLLDAVTAQAQAEFMSYRSQINPHFLFNTLECMRVMARKSGGGDLETMISAMSRMFRYSLYAKPMVSLRQELDHVRNYMRVMNIRSGNRFTLNITAAEDAADWEVPSMTLQPLVENAISHGFADRGEGAITIKAVRDETDGRLFLRVADNGKGIAPEDLEKLKQKLSSGENSETGNAETFGSKTAGALYNIQRRMRFCFGEAFSMEIVSKPGFYTVARMRVPARMQLALPEIR